VQQAALGHTEQFEELEADAAPADAPSVYYDRIAIGWRLGMGLMSGSVTWSEATHWHRFSREANGQAWDESWRPEDPWPSAVALSALAWNSIRHPRSSALSLQQGLGLRKKLRLYRG